MGLKAHVKEVHFTEKRTEIDWQGHLAMSLPDDGPGKTMVSKLQALGHESLSHSLNPRSHPGRSERGCSHFTDEKTEARGVKLKPRSVRTQNPCPQLPEK